MKPFSPLTFPSVDGKFGMPLAKRKTLILLLLVILLIPVPGKAIEQQSGSKISDGRNAQHVAIPDLSQIIPLQKKMSGRFNALESSDEKVDYATDLETNCLAIEKRLSRLAEELRQLKQIKPYKYSRLAALSEAIEQEDKIFKDVNKPLYTDIRALEEKRQWWIEQKKQWADWQSVLMKEGVPEQIETALANGTSTIGNALRLIRARLQVLLVIQEKSGLTLSKISSLADELNDIIMVVRQDGLTEESYPMLSKLFVSQLSREIEGAIRKGMDRRLWSTNRFFIRQGWLVFLQITVILFIAFVLYRSQQNLERFTPFRFLVTRPYSSGLFLGTIIASLIYNYEGAPSVWLLFNTVVVGIAFARLTVHLVEVAWKRQAIVLFVVVNIVTRMFEVLSFPYQFLRLYAVVAALICLVFCLRWYLANSRSENSVLFAWSLRLSSLFFIYVVVAELLGKQGIGLYVFVSMMRTIGIALVFLLFMYIVHGTVDWLAHRFSLRQTTQNNKDAEVLFLRIGYFIGIVFFVTIWLPAILMAWGVYGNLKESVTSFTSLGVSFFSLRITVGMFLTAASLVYGSILISWVLRRLLMARVFVKRNIERGAQLSIARLIHYLLLFIGFLLAISTLGFEMSKITILLSAFGVGIGFGLQKVVNNFVSGLILLYEQPVRVGDYIEIGGLWAEIKKIGLRSTIVQTLSEADMIIPNADLINNQVINWTLANRRVRLTIPVGVAYGSDIPLVMETLKACAKANQYIAQYPEPQILFLTFGDSSLGFEVRVWVLEAEKRRLAQSELHQKINQSFREAKIEISFPQRDLHLRSVDDSISVTPPKIG